MAEQISDAKIKATEKEHSESFDSLFVNDGEKVRQVTKEKARELMGISGAETAIEKLNTDLASAVAEIQKNTEADAETKRKLDFMWKLNQGISYQYETDANSAYQKGIPSGAKAACVNKVGGKTVVWNQLADISKYPGENHNGIAITVSNNRVYVNGTTTAQSFINFGYANLIKGHKYLYNGAPKEFTATSVGYFYIRSSSEYITLFGGKIFEYTNDSDRVGIRAVIQNNITADNLELNFQLFDLTLMFGAGNEPSTVAEFEAMFPADYYEYNAGTLMSAPVNEVVEQGKNLWPFGKVEGTRTVAINPCVIPAGTYTISALAKSNDTDKTASRIYFYYEGSKNVAISFNRNVRESKSFTLPSDSTHVLFCASENVSYSDGDDFAYEDIQVEKGTSATPYSPYRKTTYPIPEVITQLDGYGLGITDKVCNYVDWENKTYHKRVGSVDLGTLTWISGFGGYFSPGIMNKVKKPTGVTDKVGLICSRFKTTIHSERDANPDSFYLIYSGEDTYTGCISMRTSNYESASAFKTAMSGVMLYYELDEEIVTDISDLIGDTFQNPFEVEAGGTLTFKNSNGDDYRIPVPNEEEYLIALAEVTA